MRGARRRMVEAMSVIGFTIVGVGGLVACVHLAIAYGLRRRGTRMRRSLDVQLSHLMLALAWVGLVLTAPEELSPAPHLVTRIIVAIVAGAFFSWVFRTMHRTLEHVS